jgi:hypothetical protein
MIRSLTSSLVLNRILLSVEKASSCTVVSALGGTPLVGPLSGRCAIGLPSRKITDRDGLNRGATPGDDAK